MTLKIRVKLKTENNQTRRETSKAENLVVTRKIDCDFSRMFGDVLGTSKKNWILTDLFFKKN
jgi:hypothetical protein